MLYLLDTSIIIDLLRDKDAPWNFVTGHPKDSLATSAICETEIHEGIYREDPTIIDKKRAMFAKLLISFDRVLPFTSDQAEVAGKIRAALSLKGNLIGDLDILIAACALANSAILWTNNPKRFSQIPGLNILPLTG